jgi:phosphomannomutase
MISVICEGQTPFLIDSVNRTDGLRIIFDIQEIVHLRPSGNAPEFRCYTEADRPERAQEMNEVCLGVMENWRLQGTGRDES